MEKEDDLAVRKIVQAEKFKAVIEPPPAGRSFNLVDEIQNPLVSGIEFADAQQMQPEKVNRVENEKWSPDFDDSFFHITCHMDPAMRAKIENGDFVELEKLLPKDKYAKQDDQRMELISWDGAPFFISSGRYERINGIKKWEQAFRIYAAVYSRVNPNRSAEIWQYIDVIHLAAAAYSWENVCAYDTTFRRLMAQYPDHSWAKTYTQMWHLSMRDPIQRRGSPGFSFNKEGRKKERDNYCWKFQKNQKHDLANCRFDHCCKYCDGYNHGFNNCRKRRSNGKSNTTSTEGKSD